MHDHFRHHTSEEKAKETDGEPEVGPIMTVLQNFQGIALEVDRPIEVHLMESFNWYLALAMVLHSVFLAVELNIMLDWTARKSSFLIFSRRDGGGYVPECSEDRNTGEKSKEQPCK